MAGASGGEFIGIDEESTVRIARVKGQHSVVNVFLGAFGMVTRGQETAGRIGSLAGFQTGSLGVVIMTIGVVFGNVLENNAPVTFDVDGTLDLGVGHVRGAQVALGSDPVGGVVRRGSFGSSGVVIVVEGGFLVGSDVLNQIIG